MTDSSLRPAPMQRGLTLPMSIIVFGALLAAVSVGIVSVRAAGPEYAGPVTAAVGPAYFGPAPNPFAYCDNPFYFGPFPENLLPTGRIDPIGSPNASITTNDITMTLEVTAEGDPGGQYPGFFPYQGEGAEADQPKGVEMASNDEATITLSEPIFYTQWIFTDVDRENEGFMVEPLWTAPANPGQIAIFGGDEDFEYRGTNQMQAAFNDTDAKAQDSSSLAGRVQVDMLGAVTGIRLTRDTGSGQSGFAVGGGCAPLGVAKQVVSGPTWNGSSFDTTYVVRARNNLPSAATIAADVQAALNNAASGTSSGDPLEIELKQVILEDVLDDAAFTEISVVSAVSASGDVAINPLFDGINDTSLLVPGATIPPETDESFVVDVRYTPAPEGPLGEDCTSAYEVLNQASVSAVASGVAVFDLSDDGENPDPGVNNGAGETNDATVVTFDCPPPEPTATAKATATATLPTATATPTTTVTPTTTATPTTVTPTATVAATSTPIAATPSPTTSATATASPTSAPTATATPLPTATSTPEPIATAAPTAPPLPTALPVLRPAIALTHTVADIGRSCSETIEGVDELFVGVIAQPISWCFRATNTGNVSLKDVSLTAESLGIRGHDMLANHGGSTLGAGEVVSFHLNDAIPSGGLLNLANVSGSPSTDSGIRIGDLPVVSDSNDASVISEPTLRVDQRPPVVRLVAPPVAVQPPADTPDNVGPLAVTGAQTPAAVALGLTLLVVGSTTCVAMRRRSS